MVQNTEYLYNNSLFRNTVQESLRPGGLELSEEALIKCAWQPNMRVADLGCGVGASLALLNKYKLKSLGIDSFLTFLNEAKRLLQRSNITDNHLICSNINNLPLKSASLDGIICECVLSLQKDTTQAVAELFRVLKPQAKLYLSDITKGDINASSNLLNLRNVTPQQSSQSCLTGAKNIVELNQIFLKQGFSVCYFKNHAQLLTKLAAQLVWNGASKQDLIQWLGVAECNNCNNNSSFHLKQYSYSQWILQKGD